MVGYSPIYKGYKYLDSAEKVYIARHIKFNEFEFPYLELFPSTKSDQSMSLVQQNPSLVPFTPFVIFI